MPLRPLRNLEGPKIQSTAAAWLEEIEHALKEPGADRPMLCRRMLTGLLFPEYAKSWETAVEDRTLSHATRLALASTDSRNITLEPEYYADCNDEKFQAVKP